MDAVLDSTTDADAQRTRRRSRMIRAILAGGLVLGVGTAVTLAAWNDSEVVTGDFTVGSFDMEGSFDNSAWASHTAPGSPLVFSVATTNMAPNETYYAPFAVRLKAGTTADAAVTIASTLTSGSTTGLTYELVSPAAFGCTSGTTGTTLAAAGSSLVGTPTGFSLTKGATAAVAGTAVNLCFKVTTGNQASLTQGQNGKISWTFTAASS